MAQELYDELMELESKLRTIRYDTGPSLEDEVQTLQYKLAEYQLELETTLDNVRDVLRPSIEADIVSRNANLSGDVAITRDPYDVFIR